MIIKLAWRNLIGGGIRSWLNVFIISIVLVAIIGFHGLYVGWQHDAERGMIEWHIADGQLWQQDYDPYDVFSYEKSRALLPEGLNDEKTVEFLVSQGVIYPDGRSRNIVIKGIEIDQDILKFPTEYLKNNSNEIVLGHRMANKLGLKTGDSVTLRWRNQYGSFAANDFVVSHIFKTTIQRLDMGVVWVGIDLLRDMLEVGKEVTYITFKGNAPKLGEGWVNKTQDDLLAEFRAIFATELAGGVFLYVLLIFLAMIAVFDTQVLALFKRRKEVGMMMAMGMPRKQIVSIFTLEGLLSGILAGLLSLVWGTPLLAKFAETGMKLPESMNDYGMDGILGAMYPQYNIGIILMTFFIVMIILLLVSYLPVRKISKLNPVEILK